MSEELTATMSNSVGFNDVSMWGYLDFFTLFLLAQGKSSFVLLDVGKRIFKHE